MRANRLASGLLPASASRVNTELCREPPLLKIRVYQNVHSFELQGISVFKVVLQRLLMSVPLVVVVTLLTFVLNSLAPGDLASTILGADGTREQYEALRL